MAFWDDLDTTYSGEGVFTGTYGAAPYRQFIIEWRAHRLGEASRTSNFEIIFNESNGTIRTVYGATTDDGNGATLRLQQNALTGTQCACNGTGSIFPGLRVDYVPSNTAPCTITGTSGNDFLIGTGADDLICGLGGNDTLRGQGGNDRLVGGAGLDKADYADTPNAVRVDLSAGTAVGHGTDSLAEVEYVDGSAYNDRLDGDSGPNSLAGKGGDDLVYGGDGADVLFLGDGNDRGEGGPGVDRVEFLVPVSVDLTYGTASGQGSDTVKNIENVTGSPGADYIRGSAASNTLKGNGGNDTLSASMATTSSTVLRVPIPSQAAMARTYATVEPSTTPPARARRASISHSRVTRHGDADGECRPRSRVRSGVFDLAEDGKRAAALL
ncbi:MAG: hypothetical protein M3Q27_00675 [Actinomycetota bacterium]|nr:hypothetical protein [Actinomycetota bacterium]